MSVITPCILICNKRERIQACCIVLLVCVLHTKFLCLDASFYCDLQDTVSLISGKGKNKESKVSTSIGMIQYVATRHCKCM